MDSQYDVSIYNPGAWVTSTLGATQDWVSSNFAALRANNIFASNNLFTGSVLWMGGALSSEGITLVDTDDDTDAQITANKVDAWDQSLVDTTGLTYDAVHDESAFAHNLSVQGRVRVTDASGNAVDVDPSLFTAIAAQRDAALNALKAQLLGGEVNAQFDTLKEIADELLTNETQYAAIVNTIAAKAPLVNPHFSGAPDFTDCTTVVGLNKTHVGLGAVQNLSPLDMPVSSAQQTAINSAVANKSNRTGDTYTGTHNFAGASVTGLPVQTVTKASIGLGNVENLAPADMPVSTAQQTAINNAVANKSNRAGDTYTGTHAFGAATVTGLTKATVGLGNVENLQPADLPVSTATQQALNAKANLSGSTLTNTTMISPTIQGNVAGPGSVYFQQSGWSAFGVGTDAAPSSNAAVYTGIQAGTANGTSYTGSNLHINSWGGIGVWCTSTSPNVCRLTIDATNGNLSSLGRGSFATATVAGLLTAASASVAGALSAASATVSGAVNAGSVTVTNAISASNAIFTSLSAQTLAATSATITTATVDVLQPKNTSVVCSSDLVFNRDTAITGIRGIGAVSFFLTCANGQDIYVGNDRASSGDVLVNTYSPNSRLVCEGNGVVVGSQLRVNDTEGVRVLGPMVCSDTVTIGGGLAIGGNILRLPTNNVITARWTVGCQIFNTTGGYVDVRCSYYKLPSPCLNNNRDQGVVLFPGYRVVVYDENYNSSPSSEYVDFQTSAYGYPRGTFPTMVNGTIPPGPYSGMLNTEGVNISNAPVLLTLSDWGKTWKIYSVRLFYYGDGTTTECFVSGLSDYVY